MRLVWNVVSINNNGTHIKSISGILAGEITPEKSTFWNLKKATSLDCFNIASWWVYKSIDNPAGIHFRKVAWMHWKFVEGFLRNFLRVILEILLDSHTKIMRDFWSNSASNSKGKNSLDISEGVAGKNPLKNFGRNLLTMSAQIAGKVLGKFLERSPNKFLRDPWRIFW